MIAKVTKIMVMNSLEGKNMRLSGYPVKTSIISKFLLIVSSTLSGQKVDKCNGWVKKYIRVVCQIFQNHCQIQMKLTFWLMSKNY